MLHLFSGGRLYFASPVSRLTRLTAFIFLAFLIKPTIGLSQAQPATYPKVAGYVGIIHPLATFSKEGTTTNFNNHYVVGMPTGMNIWKSARIGFSMEFVPFIKAENGINRMSNFLFHPGMLVALGHGYTFVGRLAFETSGRYGFTPVLNKAVIKNKNSNFFVALPLPVRFGNDHPTAFSPGFQFGIGF